MKYDRPDFRPDLDPLIVEEALRSLFDMFKVHFDTCPRADDEELSMNGDSSPGAYYKLRYGFKKTRQVLDNAVAMQEMHEFDENPQYPTLWTASGKTELLPAQKILDNDPRTFIIPDKRFHYHCLRNLYHQHVLFLKLAECDKSWFTAGRSFQYGGFNRIMKEFLEYLFKIEGDVSKWDSSLLSWVFFNVIVPIRSALFRPNRVVVEDGELREATVAEREAQRLKFRNELIAIYTDMLRAHILMPDGEIIRKLLGMASGFFTTADDNTLYHLFVIFYIMAWKKVQAQMRLMADDHFGGTNSKLFAAFETRQAAYKLFGLTLKEAADRVSHTVEGATFLGFTARWHKGYGMFVPVYNITKALSSLAKPDGRVDNLIRYVRISAIRVLCYWTPYRDQLYALASRFYYDQFATMENPWAKDVISDEEFYRLAMFPSDRAIECLWIGFELGGLSRLRFVVEKKRAMSGNAKKAKKQIAKKVATAIVAAEKKAAASKSRTAVRPKVSRESAGIPSAVADVESCKPFKQKSITVSGKELLYTVIIPTGGLDDSMVLEEFVLNPLQVLAEIAGSESRLAELAQCWDRFQWIELEITYSPSVGTTTNGSLCMCAEADIDDSYVDLEGDPLLVKMGEAAHNFTFQTYAKARMPITNRAFFTGEKWILPFNQGDARLYTSGKIVLANAGSLVAGTYGRFYLRWRAKLSQSSSKNLEDNSLSLIATTSGTYITATYPWGDYSSIKDATTAWYESKCVYFHSDPTLGSVISFLTVGYYFVGFYRTGVAMGTGAFSGATFSGCSATWLDNPEGVGITGLANLYIANGGSTASSWWLLVQVDEPGAYMSRTADAGVTHSTGWTAVARLSIPLTVDDTPAAAAYNQIAAALTAQSGVTIPRKDKLYTPQELWHINKRLAQRKKASKGKLMLCRCYSLTLSELAAKKPTPLATGSLTLHTNSTITQGDGPAVTVQTDSEPGTEMNIGTEADPVFVVVTAEARKRLESLRLFPPTK
jgi:hypothetical protein